MDPKTTSTLEQIGLAAMVRAGERREWFFGHFGAALISGAALLRDPKMPEETGRAVLGVVERIVAQNPEWFAPLDDDSASASPNELIESLATRIATSRTSGHPTIYAVAALRALSGDRSRATRRVIDGLLALHECAHADDNRGRYWGTEDYFVAEISEGDDVPPLPDVPAAVRESFRRCRDVTPDANVDGRYHFFTGERLHLVTHAHALDCLLEMGHGDLAIAGLAAERLQMKLNRIPDHARQPLPEPSALTPYDVAFWEHDGFDVWHKLKLAEASTRLLPRLPEEERAPADRAIGMFWSLFGIDPACPRPT